MTDNPQLTEEEKKTIARFVLDPKARSTLTLQEYAATQWQDAGFEALSVEFAKHIEDTCQGDMDNALKALATQAVVLDILFQTLCRKAITQIQSHGSKFHEGYLHLALKCQKQAAATTAMLQYMLPSEKNKKTDY